MNPTLWLEVHRARDADLFRRACAARLAARSGRRPAPAPAPSGAGLVEPRLEPACSGA